MQMMLFLILRREWKQGKAREQEADSLLENAMCFISQDSSLCRAYIRGHTPYPNCFADCIHHQLSTLHVTKKDDGFQALFLFNEKKSNYDFFIKARDTQ
jgi:hypothetical protein